MAAFMVHVGYFALLSVYPIHLSRLGHGETVIGTIMGAFLLASLVIRPWVGRSLDTIGRQRVLHAGLVAFGVLSLLYGLSSAVWWVIAVRVLHGFSWAAIPPSSTTLAIDSAPASRRAGAIGYFGLLPNAATAIGPPLGLYMLNAWGIWALVGLAALCSGVGVVAARRIDEPSHPSSGSPGRAFIHPAALGPAAMITLATVTCGAILSFLPLYAIMRGMENPGLLFAVYAASLVFIRLIANRWADGMNRSLMISISLATVFVSLVGLSLATSAPTLLVTVAVYGMGFGFLGPVLLATAVDRVQERERGTTVAAYSLGYDLGMGAGTIMAGLSAEHLGFSLTFIVLSFMALAGLAVNRADMKRQSSASAG